MWLLKAVCYKLVDKGGGRQKSVNLDRKYQCLVSQIHLQISSVGFSCCWEAFTRGHFLSNTLMTWKLPNPFFHMLWLYERLIKLKYCTSISVYFFHSVILASTVNAVVFQIYSMFLFGILNYCMDVISLSTYYIFFITL